jgi:hypothetical protein
MPDILKADGTMHRIYRATISDVNRAKRSIVATINTDAVDGYKTVVDPQGMDKSEYANVVLWEHGLSQQRGTLPVGSNAWIQPIHDRGRTFVRAETRFYAKGSKGDDFTENLFEMYYDGELRGFSVNGVPDMTRCSKPTKEELRSHPHWEGASVIFRIWKLKEYSACFDPVNRECITLDEARCVLRATARGLVLPDDLVSSARELEANQDRDKLPPLGGRPYSEYRSEVLQKVQGLFDPAKFEAELKMNADYQRGVV